MKRLLFVLFLIVSSSLQSFANIDIYMRIVGQVGLGDPTVPSNLANQGYFRLGSAEIGIENTVNIGSTSAGGGAGKASFKALKITKKPSKVSTDIFEKLVTGNHYDDIEIIFTRASGSAGSGANIFLKFEMKLVLAQDLDYSVQDGDDAPTEAISLQFGAIQISYFQQNPTTGEFTLHSTQAWSRILNNSNFAVE